MVFLTQDCIRDRLQLEGRIRQPIMRYLDQELAAATQNFSPDLFIGQARGFGPVDRPRP